MNKNGKISASMMCSSLGKLPDTIHLFEEENIDYLHIDVMDGNFVTNMGYGTSYVKHMRDVTDIPLDIHLMITNPEYKLEWFDLQPTDIVLILSILVDTFISKISLPMQPVPEIRSISGA